MNSRQRLLPLLGLLVSVSSSFATENAKLSFYDPSRPGRHVMDSLAIPKGPTDDNAPIRINTLLDYPGSASQPRPSISFFCNGKQMTAVQLQWSYRRVGV